MTADVHLRGANECPERLNALRDVLRQVIDGGIKHLVIAGDLFDKEVQDYSAFEELCHEYPGVELHIIPGNHDSHLNAKLVVGDNIHIYSILTIEELEGSAFLFVPYTPGKRMGEVIADHVGEIPDDWILVGHGDYYEGSKEASAREPGTYMPLCRGDIQYFRPRAALLGHIHKPFDRSPVFCPGSPCGLDITETGRRRFIVYDTETEMASTKHVETDVLFFSETFVLVPSPSELESLARDAEARINAWDIGPELYSKVRVRVEAVGYTSDKRAVKSKLSEAFEAFRFVDDEGPRLNELRLASDTQRDKIAARAMGRIDRLEWDLGGDEPTRESIKTAALSVIYGS